MLMARRQHGPLSIGEISQGLEVCVDNCTALVADAELLIQFDRPTRALTCLLVAGQERGKIRNLNSMLTIDDDSDRWKGIWKEFYSHKSKAAGGFLSLMDLNPLASELAEMTITLNFDIWAAVEVLRSHTLYVDFDDKSRFWLSPISIGSEMALSLLPMTKRMVDRLVASREAGLYSPKALTIIRDVYASDPILDVPDPNEPADPAKLAKFSQATFARMDIIRQRLAEEGFDLS